MPLLRVSLDGKKQVEIELKPDREYIAGRGKNCDIVLKDISGISRQHVKIYHDGEGWLAQIISKFGEMLFEGEHTQSLRLDQDCDFKVPPFDFHFEFEKEEEIQEEVQADVPEKEEQEEVFKDDITFVGLSFGIPYIRIVTPQLKERILRLEGNLWTVGRDTGCEISIDEKKASRKHLEIIQDKSGYHVKDLGSANGTKLNGQTIPPNTPVPIHSGDIISIRATSLHFEIRDPNFQNKLQVIPKTPPAPKPLMHPQGAGVVKIPPEDRTDKRSRKSGGNNFVRLILILLVPLLLWGIYQQQQKSEKIVVSSTKEKDPFLTLPPEKQALVEDTYSLARNLYMQGKYETAYKEIEKLHELVPFYKDSKELADLCKHALEIKNEKVFIEEQERKKQEIKERVAAMITTCEEQMNSSTTTDKMQDCLSEAMQLDPENPKIAEILGKIEMQAELVEQQRLKRMQLAERVRRSKQLYSVCDRAANTKANPKEAIKLCRRFLKQNLPDPDGNKTKARRHIASLESHITTMVKESVDKAETLLKEAKYKDALLALSTAIKADPKNKDLRATRKKIKRESNKIMKNLYSESVLEESMGNLPVAKEKWRQIIKLDIKSSIYFKRSKRKLKTYGEE